MKQFRITKYDPQFRDAAGVYTRDEWTSYSDIGKNVSREEYEKIESAYIETAVRFLKEQGIVELKVTNLENHEERALPASLSDGSSIETESLAPIFRGILREEFWAKLEAKAAFVHFGWDYYMYIGVPDVPMHAADYAARSGLFVEECQSPYRTEL